MPQKKAKKASKPAKPKKPAAKAAPKKALSAGSVLKKAAKAVAKKVGSALNNGAAGKKAAVAKKALPAPAKLAKGAKPAKAEKAKISAKEPKKAAPPAKEEKKAAKQSVKAVPPPPAVKGKKKGEIVLEMPAPKGVALLGREGKKKGKSEAASASRKNRCREPGCEHEHLLSGFCRLHYIKNWRKIKRKESILASGQLNNYVEELVSKYPDKYLDVIRQDLASEKEWGKVVVDLELENSDEEGGGDEDLEGVAESATRRGERDFDDDNDSF